MASTTTTTMPVASPTPRRGILVRSASTDCVAKRCVKWAVREVESVFEVEEWDRSPCPVTPKLTYRDLVELKQLELDKVPQSPFASLRDLPMPIGLPRVRVGLQPIFDNSTSPSSSSSSVDAAPTPYATPVPTPPRSDSPPHSPSSSPTRSAFPHGGGSSSASTGALPRGRSYNNISTLHQQSHLQNSYSPGGPGVTVPGAVGSPVRKSFAASSATNLARIPGTSSPLASPSPSRSSSPSRASNGTNNTRTSSSPLSTASTVINPLVSSPSTSLSSSSATTLENAQTSSNSSQSSTTATSPTNPSHSASASQSSSLSQPQSHPALDLASALLAQEERPPIAFSPASPSPVKSVLASSSLGTGTNNGQSYNNGGLTGRKRSDSNAANTNSGSSGSGNIHVDVTATADADASRTAAATARIGAPTDASSLSSPVSTANDSISTSSSSSPINGSSPPSVSSSGSTTPTLTTSASAPQLRRPPGPFSGTAPVAGIRVGAARKHDMSKKKLTFTFMPLLPPTPPAPGTPADTDDEEDEEEERERRDGGRATAKPTLTELTSQVAIKLNGSSSNGSEQEGESLNSMVASPSSSPSPLSLNSSSTLLSSSSSPSPSPTSVVSDTSDRVTHDHSHHHDEHVHVKSKSLTLPTPPPSEADTDSATLHDHEGSEADRASTVHDHDEHHLEPIDEEFSTEYEETTYEPEIYHDRETEGLEHPDERFEDGHHHGEKGVKSFEEPDEPEEPDLKNKDQEGLVSTHAPRTLTSIPEVVHDALVGKIASPTSSSFPDTTETVVAPSAAGVLGELLDADVGVRMAEVEGRRGVASLSDFNQGGSSEDEKGSPVVALKRLPSISASVRLGTETISAQSSLAVLGAYWSG